MQGKTIAEVVLYGGPDKSFFYRIPEEIRPLITPGMGVNVTLRNRPKQGFIIALHATCPHKELKDLSLNPNNEVQDDMWEFYKWLSDYYICPLSDVLKNAIPRPVFFKKPVLEKWVSINPEITDRIESEKIKSAKCWECIEFLKQKKEVPYNEILNSGIGASTIKTLKKRQIVHIDLRPKQRTSTRQCETSPQIKSPPVLSPEQESVFKKIWGDFKNGDFARAFLIHGVTGSGKTFVYISLARMMLEHGYSVLVLVPEISLTPQIINRFKQFFGECIAVWHSRLSLMEKYESWNALTEGRKKIVIGVRSSVFAPLRNLGLIIVDEEHDGSYKQSESSFRYNARDAAVMRAKMSGALVVLGSATPSLESYQNAIDGKYVLLNMAQRYNQAPLPPVHLVDMAAERNVNNWGVFSNKLKDMITRRLEKKEQVILLLNRRGFSHFLICNRCGFVKKCVNCDITLTYHREENNLLCHYCGYTENVFSICPQCHHPTLKPSGVGIQKVERDLRAVFENARILRLDFDSVKRVGDVQTILEKFEKREADILIGTQMVCKGLDFPGVTLVGVILAETSLFFPDFKANERTFQMLNQVAGRAGRGEQAGEVVFQTYCPSHPSISLASINDYKSFFNVEIRQRRLLNYPPFSKTGLIRITSPDQNMAFEMAKDMAEKLRLYSSPLKNSFVLGPVPGPIKRIKKKFIFLIMIKAPSSVLLHRLISRGFDKIPSGIRAGVDVDAHTIF